MPKFFFPITTNKQVFLFRLNRIILKSCTSISANNKKVNKVFDYKKYTELLQWHNAIEHFDYNLSIDWAIELIRNGIESEYVLIVASFAKPVERDEIKPYITGALKELNLIEKYGEYSTIANTHYHLELILNDIEIRKNIRKLSDIYLNSNYDKGLLPFYLLYHGWDELEQIGANYYFEGANLDNIEEVIKEQAKIWIDKYIHGKEVNINDEDFQSEVNTLKEPTTEESFWESINKLWKKKKT